MVSIASEFEDGAREAHDAVNPDKAASLEIVEMTEHARKFFSHLPEKVQYAGALEVITAVTLLYAERDLDPPDWLVRLGALDSAREAVGGQPGGHASFFDWLFPLLLREALRTPFRHSAVRRGIKRVASILGISSARLSKFLAGGEPDATTWQAVLSYASKPKNLPHRLAVPGNYGLALLTSFLPVKQREQARRDLAIHLENYCRARSIKVPQWLLREATWPSADDAVKGN